MMFLQSSTRHPLQVFAQHLTNAQPTEPSWRATDLCQGALPSDIDRVGAMWCAQGSTMPCCLINRFAHSKLWSP